MDWLTTTMTDDDNMDFPTLKIGGDIVDGTGISQAYQRMASTFTRNDFAKEIDKVTSSGIVVASEYADFYISRLKRRSLIRTTDGILFNRLDTVCDCSTG